MTVVLGMIEACHAVSPQKAGQRCCAFPCNCIEPTIQSGMKHWICGLIEVIVGHNELDDNRSMISSMQ